MPRFFRRLAEGVFDLDDLRRADGELAEFVTAARAEYGLGVAPVAVGLSNGANIAAALLLLRPGTLGGALLLRPMVPLVPDPLPQLGGVPVQINAGVADPIVTPEQSEALGALLRQAGASVSLDWRQCRTHPEPDRPRDRRAVPRAGLRSRLTGWETAPAQGVDSHPEGTAAAKKPAAPAPSPRRAWKVM